MPCTSSADKLGPCVQEVDLLEHAASMPAEERQRQQARPPPDDVMQQLLGAAAGLQTQQTQRQNLQAQVFRPTVALPTVSVEQQVGFCSILEWLPPPFKSSDISCLSVFGQCFSRILATCFVNTSLMRTSLQGCNA